jgi:hypothetical protein
MAAPVSVAELLDGHVALQVECLDRIYLNAYVPKLQTSGGVVWFLTEHRGNPIASPALFARMGERFRDDVKRFAMAGDIPLIRFGKGDRKIDVVRPLLEAAERQQRPGVVAVGVAQEFQNVIVGAKHPSAADKAVQFSFRKEDRRVTCFYFYVWDDDFGPGFLKLCAYFPYPGKVWLNGHVRHEAPSIRAEVKGLRRWAVAAAWLKLGAARPRRRAGGWEQPRQRRDGLASPDGPGPASKTGRRTREISVNAPQVKTPAQIWRIGAGTQRTPTARRATPTPGVAVGGGGHGEGLRRTRGEAAGAQLAASPDDRWMVNVGTAGCCPPCRPARAAAGRHVVC